MADRFTTELIHHPYAPPEDFEGLQAPVHKASTIVFPNVAALRARDWRHKRGYTYGLLGTPTTYRLEERIAHLEGGRQSLLAPSGLAAISLVDLALLGQGDEVLIPRNAYDPTAALVRHELARWGLVTRSYDPLDVEAFDALLGPATKLVWLEAPGSVTMEFPDLRTLIGRCRARGVTTALDNTWGAGIALDGFAVGADVVVQALTKYPSGGGDVLMGAVTTIDEALHLRLKATHMRLGLGVAGNDVELILRSLPSMALRYAAHDRSARGLARWLQAQPPVARVLHPALPGSPGHEHWRSHCTGAAGLFSVVFAPDLDADRVDAFVDALRLFRIGYSWGGASSLAVPYHLPAIRDPVPFPGRLVRLWIGLEDEEDLRADLAQALETLR
jgi:cystathionine beta-lyase